MAARFRNTERTRSTCPLFGVPRDDTPASAYLAGRMADVADRILVLENGSILESGSHAELMALGGRYTELFDLQAAGFRSSASGRGAEA